MAAFWLILALALCAVYFAVDAETINNDADSGLANSTPAETGTVIGDDPSLTDSTTKRPIIGTTILPGMTNLTDRPTGTPPSGVNGTTTSPNMTILPITDVTPTVNTTTPPTNGTMPPANGTTPPANATEPPTNATITPGTPPPTGTTPPSPGPPPPHPPPPAPMPPTSFIYPGLLWPPMQPSVSSSVDSSDLSMSDQSGDIIIEDFKETITIHKKTIRKHHDRFEKENSGLSSDVDYGNY